MRADEMKIKVVEMRGTLLVREGERGHIFLKKSLGFALSSFC
jgi:hypothetical protein